MLKDTQELNDLALDLIEALKIACEQNNYHAQLLLESNKRLNIVIKTAERLIK
jgi:hypothetical protein